MVTDRVGVPRWSSSFCFGLAGRQVKIALNMINYFSWKCFFSGSKSPFHFIDTLLAVHFLSS